MSEPFKFQRLVSYNMVDMVTSPHFYTQPHPYLHHFAFPVNLPIEIFTVILGNDRRLLIINVNIVVKINIVKV